MVYILYMSRSSSLFVLSPIIQIPQRTVTDPHPQESSYDSFDPIETDIQIESKVSMYVCMFVFAL